MFNLFRIVSCRRWICAYVERLFRKCYRSDVFRRDRSGRCNARLRYAGPGDARTTRGV